MTRPGRTREDIRQAFIKEILQTLSCSEDLAHIKCTGGFGDTLQLCERDELRLKKLRDAYLRDFRKIVIEGDIRVSDEALAKRASRVDIGDILAKIAR